MADVCQILGQNIRQLLLRRDLLNADDALSDELTSLVLGSLLKHLLDAKKLLPAPAGKDDVVECSRAELLKARRLLHVNLLMHRCAKVGGLTSSCSISQSESSCVTTHMTSRTVSNATIGAEVWSGM